MQDNKDKNGNMSVIVSFIIVVGIIVLVVYALMHKANTSEVNTTVGSTPTTTEPTTSNTPEVKGQSATSTNTMDKVAKAGDTLIVNYTGRLTNGTVFDSNVDPKFNHVQPFEFTLGAGQVIKGWDTGFVGMKVGDKKTLTIPPEDAYGATGQGSIPPNSTLIFDVELVGIK